MDKLIAQLLNKGIFLSVEQESLKIKYNGNLISDELLQQIKKNKFELIAYLSGKGTHTDYHDIKPVEGKGPFKLSSGQHRLWVLSQFKEGSLAYHISKHIYLNEEVEIENFKRAIDSTIDRHETLRTVFREDESGEIRQWILERKDLGFVIDYLDFRKEANKREKAEAYMAADSYRAYDLEKGPLLRAALLQVEEKEYVFYYNMHHIISDGWSMEVLSKDVFKYYEAYRAGREPQLEELRIQYKDYSAWQLAQLNQESFKAHREYWLGKLSGELPLLDFPTGKQRPKVKTYNGHSLATYVDKITTAKLKRYIQENGGSLFMGLLASLNVLMYRYTSEEDIIIGTPVAGRDHADLEDQMGFYVNTLALRNEINPEESFDNFYQALKTNTLNSYSHLMYPFGHLIEELDLQRDISRSAVFDVMLILQNNWERTKGAELSEEALNQTIDQGYSTSKFDLGITAQEISGYLYLNFVFNPDVYEKVMFEGLIRHYKQLLNALLEAPEEKISQIDYLSQQEKNELLYTFNDTAVAYPKDKTIVDLFEEQAAKTPENIAVVFEHTALTYRELNERSNQLAHYLRENYDIEPDDLIGIKQARSEWMIVSILGVLKSGGAYVPIDPEYPQERIDYIEEDTNCKVCLDETELSKFKESQKEYSIEKPPSKTKSDNLIYVIYTSGSTGKPKGVMITSKAVVDYSFGVLNKTNISECKSFGFVSTISADLGNTVIFTSLLIGAALHVIAKDDIINADKMRKLNLDCIKMTPSHWKALQTEKRFFTPNKCLILGGEQFSEEVLKYVKLSNSNCEVYNHYGPTETTIGKLIKQVDKNQSAAKVCLGKPIGNNKVYILNPSQQLCPIGLTGEICISGVGLARGYLNQKELTDVKFVNSPFVAGEKLYRTGDLGKWLPNGEIEFIGRKDDQVKIRGYRIEPGEIEHALEQNKEINQAVVLAKENKSGEKELVAYVTASSEQKESELRDYLKNTLPVYMLPAYFVQLEAIPLTANGKVDKKSLPDPEGLGISSGVEYVAPRDEIEIKLVKICEEVLQRENIGVLDHFFGLGMDSLKVIRLVALIHQEINIELRINDIFENTNIYDLRNKIDSITKLTQMNRGSSDIEFKYEFDI